MRPAHHLLWSTAAALVAARHDPQAAVLAWASSLLVDLDHIAWFCLTRRSPNVLAAFAFFADPPPGADWRHAPMLLHHPALPLALLLSGRLGRQRRAGQLAGALGAGLALHQALDWLGDLTHCTTHRWRRWRSARLKAHVKQRDHWTCQHCRQQGEPLEVHHRIQPQHGGLDTPANLITLCPPCHDRAHGRPPRA
jgi:hypothetical protein